MNIEMTKMKSRNNSLLAILIVFLLSCQTEDPVQVDLIIHNAQVYTVDEERSIHEAVAVSEGKIHALGTSEEILKLGNEETQLIDAEGNFTIPGLIEGHGHFSGLGQSLMNLNFLRSKSWDEIVAMVEERVKEVEKGEWIIGRGWHQEKWEETPHDHIHGYPRHFVLSDISPDNPVLLTHASGHGLLANEKAMEMAGVNRETPDPVGGEIVRDREGNAIGVFEERAQNIIRNAYNYYLQDQSDEEKVKAWFDGIALAQKECLKNGITSFQDAGARFHEMDRYQQMARDGEFDVRLWSMLRHSSKDMKDKAKDYRVVDLGDGYFTCRAIKTELDGALGSFGAWLLESYDDKENFVGQNTTEISEVEAIADIALDADMQLCVHAIGDRANREVLDLMEREFQTTEKEDLRWRIEHSQHLHPDDIPRFGSLGVIASMQGIHCTSDAPYVEKRLGFKRAKEGAYNWRAIVDSGGVVTNGTDAPVEDVNAIESYYATVTRKRIDNGFEFFPENALTRDEALYSYTMANAFAAFEDEDKGSIEVGKYADITILSEDWINCSDEEILDTEVLYTIVGGEVKFEAISD